jgi:hypothetical protein
MRSAVGNEISSLKNLPNLKVDFYESGIGETIVITFPSGDIALVDAHPSQYAHRPDIADLVKGKKLRFVCFTHPHLDHGADLVSVLQTHPQIDSFWHTIYQMESFIFGIGQAVNFPSEVRDFATSMSRGWGEFLIDLYGAVAERDINEHCLRSDLEPHIIDGVEIHCLSPEEAVQNDFFRTYKKRLTDPKAEFPDPNLLSAVLALKFGDSLLLLGADALKKKLDNRFETIQ